MPLFRKAVAVIGAAIVISLGVGDLWCIEVDAVDGRPWDPGSVQQSGNDDQHPLFKRGPDHSIGTSGHGTVSGSREQKKASFDLFLNDLFSFLDH